MKSTTKMTDEKSVKKRKRPLHNKDKRAKSKKRKTERAQDDFTEAKFKSLLHDPETTLSGRLQNNVPADITIYPLQT